MMQGFILSGTFRPTSLHAFVASVSELPPQFQEWISLESGHIHNTPKASSADSLSLHQNLVALSP